MKIKGDFLYILEVKSKNNLVHKIYDQTFNQGKQQFDWKTFDKSKARQSQAATFSNFELQFPLESCLFL